MGFNLARGRRTIEEIAALRDATESSDAATRHEATLTLIASGHYLAYSDARYAARLALTGAHARSAEEGEFHERLGSTA